MRDNSTACHATMTMTCHAHSHPTLVTNAVAAPTPPYPQLHDHASDLLRQRTRAISHLHVVESEETKRKYSKRIYAVRHSHLSDVDTLSRDDATPGSLSGQDRSSPG